MPLGVDVALIQRSNVNTSLVVEHVVPGGLIDLWNRRSKTPHQLQPGDLILDVNDIPAWQHPQKRAQEFASDRLQVIFTVTRKPHGMAAQQAARRPGAAALSGTRQQGLETDAP